MQRGFMLVAPGVVLATGAGLLAHARRVAAAPLPHFEDGDPSGRYGDPVAEPVRIDVLGDSSVTGPGLTHGSLSWIAQLADRLAWDVQLRSLARGGSRVADVLRDQAPVALGDPPDLFVVSVGANDALHATPGRRFRRELGALFDQLAAAAPVVSLGIGDLSVIPRLPPTLRPLVARRSAHVDRLHRSVASGRAGVVRVPAAELSDPHFRAGGHELFTNDLFHPNEVGHAMWAQLFEPFVRSTVEGLLLDRGSPSIRA